MSHWIVVPVILPALTAVYLLLSARHELATHRTVSVLATLGLLGVGTALVVEASGGAYQVYALGDWPAPFGIVLVLDRLSALMVLLTAIVAVGALVYAVHGWDTRGRNFHALFQFQLMGLNGAFLTGDVFNLFVFFEILLIASYGLLLHGGGRERVRAGIHYVVFNLAASALFLVALALLYGTLGTLNMADLVAKVATIGQEDAALVRIGALLLLIVFAVKAAALPLYFWLPQAYASAGAPVASLFAIMTKVGIYAILRVFGLAFGPEAGELADLAQPLLLVGGLLTLALGTLGVLACRGLRRVTSYLVISSVGTLLVALGLSGPEALAAALYYMVHSTLVIAALFLLAELIADQRGEASDGLRPAVAVAQPGLLGSLFLVGAVAIVGMPPLSGFVGKTLVLRSAVGSPAMAWVFGVVLGTGLLAILALGRAGSTLFWKTAERSGAAPAPAPPGAILPAAALLGLSLLLVLAAGPVYGFLADTAAQLTDPSGYVQSVLGFPAGD